MSLIKFTGLFMAAGFLIPIVFWFLSTWTDYSRSIKLSHQVYIERIMLMLWPTSIINLAGAADDIFAQQLFLISAASNVLIYGLFGLLMWFGIRRHRWVLVPLFIGLILLWWRLLTL
jgi:hypothetical protein